MNQEIQTLEYLKKVTHLYKIDTHFIWCVEQQKIVGMRNYVINSKVFGPKMQRRCNGCGMITKEVINEI